MNNDSVSIKFQLTLDDYAKFSADTSCNLQRNVSIVNSFFMTMRGILVGFALILPIGLIFIQPKTLGDVWSYLLGYLSPTILLFFLAASLFFTLMPRFSKKSYFSCSYKNTMWWLKQGANKAILSPSEITFSSEAVLFRNQYTNVEVKWAGVEKVVVQAGDLCVFLSSISAYVLPQRYFSSEDEKYAVYNKCKDWFDAAQAADAI